MFLAILTTKIARKYIDIDLEFGITNYVSGVCERALNYRPHYAPMNVKIYRTEKHTHVEHPLVSHMKSIRVPHTSRTCEI